MADAEKTRITLRGLATFLAKLKDTFATKTALATKQDNLAYDSIPTPSSTNILTSGIISNMFPVGAVVINVTGVNPSTYLGGTWQEVGSGKVLWGADSSHEAGSTISAGLPNITGSTGELYSWLQGGTRTIGACTPASYQTIAGVQTETASNGSGTIFINFDASKSNALYGASDTVQPPAYVVHFWQRTA